MPRLFRNTIIGIFLPVLGALAQPGVDFTIQPNACTNEVLNISNLSDPGAVTHWDFCATTLDGPYSGSSFGSIATFLTGLEIVNDNGNWFGFATSRSNEVVRINFGASPLNSSYSITSLGNPEGLLNSPESIALQKDGNTWYGLVTNLSNDLVRLEWSSLSESPNAISLNTAVSGKLNQPSQIEIKFDNGNYVAVVANGGANTLTFIDFGASLANIPSVSDVQESIAFPGATNMYGLTIVRQCQDWEIYTIATDKIYKVDAGAVLSSTFIVSQIDEFASVFADPIGSFNRIKSFKYFDKTFIYFTSFTEQSLRSASWKAGETTPQVIELGTLPLPPLPYSLAVVNDQGNYSIYVGGFNAGAITTVQATSSCAAVVRESTDFEPKGVYFQESGIYTVGLTITYANGLVCSKSQEIDVNALVSPTVEILVDGTCANFNSEFDSSVDIPIVTYNWDFGDTNTSMLENPTHQYTSAGEYEVLLSVTASNGCNNTARQNITIYNEPVPDFNLPAAAPICTNQEYFFTNNSAFDAGSNPTWQWEVNGNPVSTDLDLSYSISTSIQQDVKLIASIPGCSNEIMKSILTVEEGPLADFTFNNGCVETSILFTNTTAGPVIGYSWDFGDTNVSSQTNGQNTYTGFGVYDVTLTASNAVGCNNSTTKLITIYSKPQPDFSIDLPPFSCSGSPSQFNDLTPNPTDSNLSGWTWSFGDPSNGTSITRNPLYTYSNAGSYDVQLDVITNFGCSNAVQKTINIAQSPPSGFSFNPACVNQGTVFTPNAINGINSWQWTIGTATYSSPSPTHVFSFPSTYNAQLTVTGANGCVAISSQPITVPAVPSLDFSASNLCEDQPVEFMDATLIGLDVPVSWAWEFGTVGTASGKNPSFTFDDPGSYPTRMTVTNQSGCKYSISKNISVVTSPTATFTATPQIGTAPLVVQLTNTTTNSNSQLWTINGTGETSTDDSPTFTFNNLGDYVIDLTVTNDQGCESTTSKTVSVVIPTLDLELTSLTVVPAATGEQRLLVSVKNNSNSTIAGPKLAVDIAGQAIINELLNITLLPGATHTQMLATQVVGARGDLDYICVEIVLDGDFNKSNNKKCVGARSISVLDPYPNPSTETINLEWISQKSGNAEVYIFSSTGNKVFENAFSDFQPGLNRVAVAVDKLNPGIYYLLFVTGDSRRSFPVVIRR